MDVALYLLIWGIWAKNGKLAVTFKYLIQFSKPRAHWMQNHEKIRCRVMRRLSKFSNKQ